MTGLPTQNPPEFNPVNVQITDINETRKTLTVTLDKGEVDAALQLHHERLRIFEALGDKHSLAVALGATCIGSGLGAMLGLASGYLGGWFDLIVQRIAEIMKQGTHDVFIFFTCTCCKTGRLQAVLQTVDRITAVVAREERQMR